MAILEDGLTVETMDHHGVVLLDLIGELTAMEAPVLYGVLDTVLQSSPRNVQLGLRSVSFIDSGGLQALVRVRQRLIDAGVPMQLLGTSARVQRMLDVTNLTGVFTIIE